MLCTPRAGDGRGERNHVVPQQKEAIVVLVSSIAFSAFALLLWRWLGKFGSEAIFGALAAFIAVLWIARRIVGLKQDALDERDLAVRYRAAIAATYGFGLVVMLGAAGLWAAHRESLMAPTVEIALLAFYGWMAMYLTWSVAVLLAYGRGGS